MNDRVFVLTMPGVTWGIYSTLDKAREVAHGEEPYVSMMRIDEVEVDGDMAMAIEHPVRP